MGGFCSQNKCTRGLRHQIVLYRNTHGNMIHQDANAAANSKVYIERIRLWCPVVKPSLQAVVDIESKLNQSMPMRMDWEARNMYRSGTIGANDLSFEYRVTTSVSSPTHVFVTFQGTQVDDDEELNNQIFQHQNLSSAELRINSVQVPKEKLETSFAAASKNVARAYQMFESYKNKFDDSETGSVVTRSDYSSIYPILHFDLTKQVGDNVFNVNGGCDITFRGTRSAAGTDTHVLVLVLSDRSAQVTGASNNLRLELL